MYKHWPSRKDRVSSVADLVHRITGLRYIREFFLCLPHYVRTYGTARFKIQACVRMRRMHFAICYEHFSKLCISVGNCTGILCAIHDSVYMIA